MILTNMSCNPDSGEAEFPHKVVLSLVSRPPKLFGGRIIGKMISKNNAVYSVLRAAWAEYGSVCMTELEGVSWILILRVRKIETGLWISLCGLFMGIA